MRAPAPEPDGYSRRRPEETDLYRVVQAYRREFLDRAEEAGGLPRFVADSLEGYLRCGILAHGFARVWCRSCGDDMLVAWSCKRRGICPCCGGRRMADTAAHLVDCVFPEVPVRQWVLTFPQPLRTKLAYDSKLRTAVLGLYIRCVENFYEAAGAACGRANGRTGAVTVIQRFGSALNLNLHLHSVFPDGVFYRAKPGRPLRFQPLPRVTDEDVAWVFEVFCRRLERLLRRRGFIVDDEVPDEAPPEEAEPLEQLALASSLHLSALGRPPTSHRKRDDSAAARRKRRRREQVRTPLCVREGGMSLHANTVVKARQIEARERLFCYLLRPPVVIDRVRWRQDGLVELSLPRAWSNGTTSFTFEPLAFLARLAPLIPAPRTNDTRYHGVFAPNARWRREVAAMAPGRLELPTCCTSSATNSAVPQPNAVGGTPEPPISEAQSPSSNNNVVSGRPNTRLSWSELLSRTFSAEVLRCARCGGRREVLAMVTDPDAVRAILMHLGLPAEPPPTPPNRGPPQQLLDLP